MAASDTVDGHGIDLVTRYLRDRGVDFDVVDHRETMSATEEADASGIPPDHAAKTVVLRDGSDYRLAVIPASHRLDLHKAREAFEASSHLRLATEEEMKADMPAFETGATPPLGQMIDAPEILDRHLMDHERILCTGGDHRHSVLIAPDDLARLCEARVSDVCED
jgi:Ala-tRNA(Pro) deacylase